MAASYRSGTDVPAGLCDHCRHARRVVSARGSTFTLCERAATDARYPRYPRLPVQACSGFERREPDAHGSDAHEPPGPSFPPVE
jgi:hypothetical protein